MQLPQTYVLISYVIKLSEKFYLAMDYCIIIT